MHESPALKRRIIFVDVSARGQTFESPVDDFAIAVTRRPLFFADVHLHTGEVLARPRHGAGKRLGHRPDASVLTPLCSAAMRLLRKRRSAQR